MKRRFLILLPALLACGPFFYQAPPPLPRYPERVPTKAWDDILNEVRPARGEADLVAAAREFLKDYAELPPAFRLVKFKVLAEENRQGDFRIGFANFLIEACELAESDLDDEMVASFLTERLDELADPATWPARPTQPWDMSDAEYARHLAVWRRTSEEAVAALDAEVEAAPASLRPYALVRAGGELFRHDRAEEADERFQAVVRAFPEHPRAEVARFMSARCALETARAVDDDHRFAEPGSERYRSLGTAEDRFRAYLDAFPQGRFADDAEGWLGGIAEDRGRLAEAVDQQLRRLEIQSTREVLRSVLRECDRLFGEIFRNAAGIGGRGARTGWFRDHPDYRLMVGHPAVARLLVFHALDPAARGSWSGDFRNLSGDRVRLDFLRRRIIRPFGHEVLRGLGRAVRESGVELDATSLLILGWSAMREGDEPQALVLFERALAGETTDELLHGRAVALSRLGRDAEAADAYERLLREFPESPLAAGSRFDHALALQRGGRAGEAFLSLLRLADEVPDRGETGLHTGLEIRQWLDATAQFSPVGELRAPLGELAADDPRAALLRAIVRTRALCEGDFETAAGLLGPAEPPAFPLQTEYYGGRGSDRWNPVRFLHLDRERWENEVAELARLEREVEEAAPERRAGPHLACGRAWRALRGRVTLPLHGILDAARSESETLNQLRRANGRFLGLPLDRVDAALASRDELHHALEHFLAAAGSSDAEVAAPALEAANEALFRLAEFSLHNASRAVETDATALSERLVTRLETEFPDRPETARAIRYTFAPPAVIDRWMPGNIAPWRADHGIAEAVPDPAPTPEGPPVETRLDAVRTAAQLTSLLDRPLAETRVRLAEARATLDDIRPYLVSDHPHLASSPLIPLVDDLDDLTAAASAPDVDAGLFREYAALRLGDAVPPEVTPEWRPLASFLDFLGVVRRASADRPAAESIAAWRGYLAVHPHGPKSEAASLRLLRLRVRQACPIPHVRAFHFPEAPITDGYKQLEIRDASERFHAGSLSRAIAAHRESFPDGRYAADLAVLEAAVAARAGDYPLALENLAGVLSDPAHPELRQDASLYFAEIGQRLLDTAERPALMPAFREDPTARRLLGKLAGGPTCLFRLRPLLPALEE